jgi:hypothetical protein
MKVKYFMVALILGALMLIPAGVRAGDALDVTYTYTTPESGQFKDDVEQHEVKVDGALPFLNFPLFGYDIAAQGLYQLNMWQLDEAGADDLDLHKFKVTFGTVHPVNEEIALQVFVAPGIHSDLEDVGSDAWRVDAGLIGSYVYNPDLSFVFGVVLGEEFGEAEAYPVGGVRWQAADSIEVDLVIPHPKITYTHSDQLSFYVAGEPTGGEWNVETRGKREFDVQQKGFRVGIGGEYQCDGGGSLYLMVGAEVERELDIAEGDTSIFGTERELDDAEFIQIGYRVN